MSISRIMLGLGVALTFALPEGAAGAACTIARNMMERLICGDPAVAARDTALTVLYRVELMHGGEAVRVDQRRWLVGTLQCRTRACLIERYDERNGRLLQGYGGRMVAQRFHLENGDRNGDLLILRRNDWITYDVVETVVGPQGEAAGDISAARMQGTARLAGSSAREIKPDGCIIVLQRDRDAGWSVSTRRCFDGDRADLNGLFRPAL